MKLLKSLLKSSVFYNLLAVLVVIFIYFTNQTSSELPNQGNHTNQNNQNNQNNPNNQALSQGRHTCQLLKVVDGDSINVSCNQQHYSIRLADIDAPELAQTPWGERSKAYLAKLLPNSVALDIGEKDRYQRYLATVFVDDNDVAIDLLSNGYAVIYSQYNPPKPYKTAMQSAKSQQLGVWASEGLQQNPQLYRRLAL